MNPDIIKEALYYEQLSLPLLILVYGGSFILGAIHALGPGHGKSLMAGYLIGTTGRLIDAFILALTITISHVFSVVLLGFVALWLADFFLPEIIGKWFGLFSGITILGIGSWLFIKRLRGRANNEMNSKNIPEIGLNRVQHADHQHHHHYQSQLSIWSNIALGISSGIVPCPKAVVILLLAISLQKIALGISIIIMFSLGISFVLIVLGIIMVKASYLLKGRLEGKSLQIIPLLGSMLIIGIGILVTVRTIRVL